LNPKRRVSGGTVRFERFVPFVAFCPPLTEEYDSDPAGSGPQPDADPIGRNTTNAGRTRHGGTDGSHPFRFVVHSAVLVAATDRGGYRDGRRRHETVE